MAILPLIFALCATGALAADVIPGNGPYAGGNTILVTNAAPNLGNGVDITNIVVGGVGTSAVTGQGENWVSFIAPAASSAGLKDLVIQSESEGDTTLAGAYTVNPAGSIFGYAAKVDQWEEVRGLPVPRARGRCVDYQDRLYFMGGEDESSVARGTVYTYNGTNWVASSNLPGAVQGFGAAVYSNKIQVVGGYDQTKYLNTLYQYDGTIWASGSNVPVRRSRVQVGVMNGQLYSVAGYSNNFKTNVCYYNNTTWKETAGYPLTNMYDMAVAPYSNVLYVLGGGLSGWDARTNVFTFNGTTWAGAPGLPQPRLYGSSLPYDGGLYYIAGLDSAGIKSNVFLFNGATWSEVAALPRSLYDIGATVFRDQIYVAGGKWSYFDPPATNVYRYPAFQDVPGVFPASGSWAGGYPVVINGSNLCDGTLGDVTNVILCGVAATVTGVAGSTQIVVVAGSGVPGLGDARVFSASFGETVKNNAFTYTGAGILVSGPAFGPVAVGAVVTNIFTVTNSGTLLLEIWDTTNDGPGAAYFDVQLPEFVEPGTASNFPVVFTAGEAGTFTPTCYILNNSPVDIYSFGLSGKVYSLSTYSGPYAGGNTITITNGYFGTITNVIVGGVAATIQASGDNWVRITVPAVGSAGVKDVVVQTSDNGDTTLAGVYTYNPPGQIGPSKYGAVIDSTQNGTYTPGPGAGWISATRFFGIVIATPSNSIMRLHALKLAMFNSSTAEPANVRIDLYQLDGTNVPIGEAVTSTNVIFNLATNAAYYDVSLNPAQFTVLEATNFALVLSATNLSGSASIINWTTAAGSYTLTNGVRVVGGRTTSNGGTTWTTNNFAKGLQVVAEVYDFGVNPSSGSYTGGYTVVITGTNLCDGTLGDVTNVTLCGAAATVTGVNGSTQIVVMAGVAPSSGLGDVRVFSAGFGETMKANAFTYTKENQTITFAPITSKRQTAVVGLAAEASSGLAVSFHVASGPGTIDDGTNLSFSGAGAVSVVASQAGNGQWNPALNVTNIVQVYALTAYSGPYAGGNTITITNGYFGTITNVTVGGVAATIQASGDNWVTITVPAVGSAGAKDVVIQTSDNGDTTLAGVYTVNNPGVIFSKDWKRWEEMPGLPGPRSGLTAATLNGYIYAIGGTFESNVYRFDGLSWTEVASMPSYRSYAAASVLNDAIYVMGGANGGSKTNVFRFDGASWTEVKGIIEARDSLAAATWSNALYAIGGSQNSSGKTNVYRYDGTNWSEVMGLATIRVIHAAATWNGAMYQVSGYDTATRTNVYRYDGDQWVNVAGVPASRFRHAAAAASEGLYMIAGDSGTTRTNVYRYDGATWTEVAGLSTALSYLAATELDGYIYTVGGRNGSDAKTNVFRYPALGSGVSPSSGAWTGGYAVVISGSNLCDGTLGDVTSVTLCGVAATVTGVSGGTQIVVTAGAGTPGMGDVVVHSTSYGVSLKANAFTYLRVNQAPLVFTPASPQAYLTTNALSLSGGSGTGGVSYALVSGPGLIVDDVNLTVTAGVGTVRVRATKSEDDLYFTAAVTGSVTAAKASQTIMTFLPTNGSVFVMTDIAGLSAMASSGLPVSFATNGGPGLITGGTNLSFTAGGEVAVVALQAGDANWLSAPEQTNVYTVLAYAEVTLESAHGSTIPVAGVYTMLVGTVFTSQAQTPDTQDTTQYVCAGWVATENLDPAGGVGTQAVVTVNGTGTLTWLWNTEYYLTASAGPNGSIDRLSGWLTNGATVEINATADQYYHFTNWTGSVASFANPLNLTMDGAKWVTAHFAADTTSNNVPIPWLVEHGITNDFEAAVTNDPDEDGIPTGDEYAADTNPTNRDSCLRMQLIWELGDNLRWAGGTSVVQYLEWSEDAADNNPWSVIATNLPPMAVTNEAVVPYGLLRGFYRVRAVR